MSRLSSRCGSGRALGTDLAQVADSFEAASYWRRRVAPDPQLPWILVD